MTEMGVLCHECGLRFTEVGHHLVTHGIDITEYRTRHGLTWRPDLSLSMPRGQLAKRSCPDCGTLHSRDAMRCPACAQAWRAPKPPPEPRPRWRPLTNDEVETLRTAEGADLSALVRELQRSRVASRTIGQSLGLTPRQMTLRFPRLDWGRRGRQSGLSNG